jgi:lipopolysaccharide transport system permease protein
MGTGSPRGPAFSFNPLQVFAVGWRHRALIERLTRREISAKYQGAILGSLWSLLTPLMMLAVYTFLFSVVFQSRWGVNSGGGGGRGEFALLFFSGMIIFTIFSEPVMRAPALMLENVSYIKKVVFPLEILPLASLGVALFNGGVSFVVLAVFYLLVFGLPPLTILLLPLVLLPLCLATLGVTWFLASVGVFLRDVRQLVTAVTTALMFLSPIFYPVTAVPESYRWLLYINPLTITLEASKEVLFWGHVPDPVPWAVDLLAGWLMAWLGYVWFMKTRKAFADVV